MKELVVGNPIYDKELKVGQFSMKFPFSMKLPFYRMILSKIKDTTT